MMLCMLLFSILYYNMLYYIILYYIILYYNILYYIILCYIILHYSMLYYTMLCYIVLYYILLYYISSYQTILQKHIYNHCFPRNFVQCVSVYFYLPKDQVNNHTHRKINKQMEKTSTRKKSNFSLETHSRHTFLLVWIDFAGSLGPNDNPSAQRWQC